MFVSFRQLSSCRYRSLIASTVAGVGFIMLTSLTGFAGTDKPATGSGAKRGAAIFQERCITCHHKEVGDTSPFGPPNLHGILRQKTLTPAQAATIIKGGRNTMPAFGNTLSAAQINDVIAYLKTQ